MAGINKRKKGNIWQNICRKQLIREGYYAIDNFKLNVFTHRFEKSAFPDLIAVKNGVPFAFECKAMKSFPKSDVLGLNNLKNAYGFRAAFLYPKYGVNSNKKDNLIIRWV